MNPELEARLLEIENTCLEIRRDQAASVPTQIEAMIADCERPAVMLRLLAPDGSSIEVYVEAIVDCSISDHKVYRLTAKTASGPQPAKGEQ